MRSHTSRRPSSAALMRGSVVERRPVGPAEIGQVLEDRAAGAGTKRQLVGFLPAAKKLDGLTRTRVNVNECSRCLHVAPFH
jgi:hypothetical protein